MLSVKEVAILVNVHPRTILRWIKSNKLKATQIGRNYKISKEEVEYILTNGLR